MRYNLAYFRPVIEAKYERGWIRHADKHAVEAVMMRTLLIGVEWLHVLLGFHSCHMLL